MRKLLFILPLLALGACADKNPGPISANPVQDVNAHLAQVAPGAAMVGGTIQQGLLDAEWNLDQAILVGALPKNDPADSCLHGALTQLGIEPNTDGTAPPPAPSFTPRESDLISRGSVLYIRAQQAKALAGGGGLTVPVGCEAIIGRIMLDAAKQGGNLVPGGSIINQFLPKT